MVEISIGICSSIKAPPHCWKSLTYYWFQCHNCSQKDAPRTIIMYYLKRKAYWEQLDGLALIPWPIFSANQKPRLLGVYDPIYPFRGSHIPLPWFTGKGIWQPFWMPLTVYDFLDPCLKLWKPVPDESRTHDPYILRPTPYPLHHGGATVNDDV